MAISLRCLIVLVDKPLDFLSLIISNSNDFNSHLGSDRAYSSTSLLGVSFCTHFIWFFATISSELIFTNEEDLSLSISSRASILFACISIGSQSNILITKIGLYSLIFIMITIRINQLSWSFETYSWHYSEHEDIFDKLTLVNLSFIIGTSLLRLKG